MERVRIAQFSDLHLGVNLAGGKLMLPEDKARRRRSEQRAAFTSFASYVRETSPDIVLIAGDLFETGEPEIDDLNFAINTVNSMGGVPVFIIPGNHDPYGPSSCYETASALYQGRPGGPKWGRHVHIFTSERFETVEVHTLPGVTVTASAFQRHTPPGTRPLGDLRAPESEGVHLLLFHGSLENYPQAWQDTAVCPFTVEELEAAGFHYAAVGHYHHGGRIEGRDGRVLGAYAGAPMAFSLSEAGAGTWLEVELVPGQPLSSVSLRWHRSDARQVHRLELDVTGHTDSTSLAAHLEKALEGVSPDDIVYLVVRGRLTPGVEFDPAPVLSERFFHAVVDASGVEPDYSIDFDAEVPEELDLAATSEEVFRWKMLKLYREAGDEARRALVREALFYGLDALKTGKVHLR